MIISYQKLPKTSFWPLVYLTFSISFPKEEQMNLILLSLKRLFFMFYSANLFDFFFVILNIESAKLLQKPPFSHHF